MNTTRETILRYAADQAQGVTITGALVRYEARHPRPHYDGVTFKPRPGDIFEVCGVDRAPQLSGGDVVKVLHWDESNPGDPPLHGRVLAQDLRLVGWSLGKLDEGEEQLLQSLRIKGCLGRCYAPTLISMIDRAR